MAGERSEHAVRRERARKGWRLPVPMAGERSEHAVRRERARKGWRSEVA